MVTDMGQVYCELSSENLSDQSDIQIEPASQLLDHGSISFGRFSVESLAWEKWSSFSQNRCLEEVQRCSAPGSVAKKKAYFEAYYKRIAAQKALQEQEELAQQASQEASQQAWQGHKQPDFHCEDKINNSKERHDHHVYEDVTSLQTVEENGIISESPSTDNSTYFQASEQLNEEAVVTNIVDFDGSSVAYNHEQSVLHTCKQESDGNFVVSDNILHVPDRICASSGMIPTYDSVIANEEIGEEANQLVHSQLLDGFQHEELLGEDLSLKNETQVQEDSDRVVFESQTDALVLTAVTETGIAKPVKHYFGEIGRTEGILEEVEEKNAASKGAGNEMTFDPKPLSLSEATEVGISESKEHDIQEMEKSVGVLEEIEEKKIVPIHANVVSKKSKQSKESTLKESAASCGPKITKDHKPHLAMKEVLGNSRQISKSQVLSGFRPTGNSTPRVSKSQIAAGLISGNSASQISRSQISSRVTSGNFTLRKSQTGLSSRSTNSGKAIPKTLPKTESIIVLNGNKSGGDKPEGDRSTNCANKLPNMRASQSNLTVPRPFSLATDKRASKAENNRDNECLKTAEKVLQNRINVPRNGKTEASYKLSKVPVTKHCHLEDGRSHRVPKIPVVNNSSKEKQAKDQGCSTISECSSSPGIVKLKPRPNAGGTTFSFKSNERAVKRQEFYTKLGEKTSAKEAEKNQLQAKTQEEKDAELIKLRKNLKFKATPMPNFYHDGGPPTAEIKKIPPTCAKSPRFGRKNTGHRTILSKSLQTFKPVSDQENKNNGLGEKQIYVSGRNRDTLQATNSSSLSKKVPSSPRPQLKKEPRHVLCNGFSKTEGKRHSEGQTSLKKSEADGVKLVSTNFMEDPYPFKESTAPGMSTDTIPKVLNVSQDMNSTEDAQM